nr:MAG TPA_asm: Monocytic leukemia zinc finger protein finger, acetyl transferase, DNA [Caudoviricetes sp.]
MQHLLLPVPHIRLNQYFSLRANLHQCEICDF